MIALAMLFVAAQAQAACAVQGSVVDSVSGNGMTGVRVYAVPEGNGAAVLRRSVEHGRFCFEEMSAGKYRVEAHHAGYLDSAGPAIEVSPGRMLPEVHVRLVARPVVTGTVLHADGQPAAGSQITVWRRTRVGPDQIQILEADDRGMFRLSSLPPGTYYLSAAPDEEANYLGTVEYLNQKGERQSVKESMTYFPGVLAFSEARPITLRAGQEVAGVVIGLREGTRRRLSGRIAGFTDDLDFEIQPLSFGEEGASFAPAADGQFVRGDLAPGKYVVSVKGESRAAEQVVDLTNGDVEGLIVQPQPTFSIPVTVKGGGDDSGLMLVSTGPREQIHHAEDGGFSGLLAGMYKLQMSPRVALYLKSAALNGKAVPPERVELRGSSDGALEVVLSSGMARIDGHLTAANSDPVMVVLAHGDDWKSVPADVEGKFSFAAVVPGKYRVWAIEGFDDESWDSAIGALLPGTDVELAEREVRRLGVPVVTAAAFQAAVARQ